MIEKNFPTVDCVAIYSAILFLLFVNGKQMTTYSANESKQDNLHEDIPTRVTPRVNI